MSRLTSALQEISHRLLFTTNEIGAQFKAADDLYNLFLEVDKLHWDNKEHGRHLASPQGTAIGPVWAAMCIKDALRTHQFLRGILQAIRVMQAKLSGQRIHLLYAGTGPFATLALPLTTVLSAEEIQFTFIEVNEVSISTLQKTIEAFEIQPFIYKFIRGDATNFTTDPAHPVHIIVAETMQAGLQKEPQVAMTLHLAPQLAPEGVFIPQQVLVHAGLIHPVRNTERMLGLEDSGEIDHYHLLGPIFELNSQTSRPVNGTFQPVMVTIPNDLDPGFTELALFTRIQVFDNFWLNYGESALTQPLVLGSISAHDWGKACRFSYGMGQHPGFQWLLPDTCTILFDNTPNGVVNS